MSKKKDWVDIPLGDDGLESAQQALTEIAAASPNALREATVESKSGCSPFVTLYSLSCVLLMFFYTLSGSFSMVMSGYTFYLQTFENETEEALAVALNRTAHAEGVFGKIAYPWLSVVAIFKGLFHFINIYLGIQFLKEKFEYSKREGFGFLGFFLLGLLASMAAGGMPTFANLAGLIMASYAFGLTIGPGLTLSFALSSWITSDVGNAFWFLLHVPMMIDFMRLLFQEGYSATLLAYREKGSKGRLMDLKGDEVPSCQFRLIAAVALYVVLSLSTGYSYLSAYRVDGCAAPWSVLSTLSGFNYTIGPFNGSDEFMDFYRMTIGNKSYDYDAYSPGLQLLGVWNAFLHWIRYNVLLLKYIVIPLASLDFQKKGTCTKLFMVALMLTVVIVVLGIPNFGSVTEGFSKDAVDALAYFKLFDTVASLLTSDTAKLAVPMDKCLQKVEAANAKERPRKESCCGVKLVYIGDLWAKVKAKGREAEANAGQEADSARVTTYIAMTETVSMNQ